MDKIGCACLLLAAFGFSQEPLPRPEHPRPDLERAEWLNLNGVWEFAETDDDKDESFLGERALPDKILVPFCRESRLSGLGRRGFVRNVWYRRGIAVPGHWKSPRIRLHVGASDWRTRAWLNGEFLGAHTGGSAPFAFELTGLLRPGENRLVLHAFDDPRGGLQAAGKQSLREESHGCVYTRTTGIWQTVWLEGVGETCVRELAVEPDPENGRVAVAVGLDGPSEGLAVEARAFLGERPVGGARARAGGRSVRLLLELGERRLWSPEEPTLFRLELRLERGEELVDRIQSWFGLRRLSIQGRALLLNGRPLFQRLVLDQGFYPEGIWTAPSDAALRRDIELAREAGFDGARLHQKVFEPRFLHWADRLGYLVWGEYPNWGLDHARPAAQFEVLEEWGRILGRDRNHPALVGWCAFNETPASAGALQRAAAALARALDPGRPVLESSGWTHTLPDPELLDAHDYDQDPERFRGRWAARMGEGLAVPARYGVPWPPRVPFMVSEYGGIGWFPEAREPAWGYGRNPASVEEFHARFAGLAAALLENRFLFGMCYTQLTDIEQERNGLYFYDRAPKFDVARLRSSLRRPAAYEQSPPLAAPETPYVWRLLVGAAPDGEAASGWRYTLAPPPEGWRAPAFDDSAWSAGRGGFGRKEGNERWIATPWATSDLWLRRGFVHDGKEFEACALVLHHDDALEIHLNGEPFWSRGGWNDRYEAFAATERAKALLRPGPNVLAVHCRQERGGQFLDLALLLGVRGR